MTTHYPIEMSRSNLGYSDVIVDSPEAEVGLMDSLHESATEEEEDVIDTREARDSHSRDDDPQPYPPSIDDVISEEKTSIPHIIPIYCTLEECSCECRFDEESLSYVLW